METALDQYIIRGGPGVLDRNEKLEKKISC
jgi:hypothetical protein